MSIWLTAEEVQELTARKRWSAQCRALQRMGVAFRPNAAGRPLVERAAVEKAARTGKSAKRSEPDWEALGGKAA